ncbi:hypothetical protein Ahy_B08g091967 [Arachis hypogaea]|uniref:Uncharacterized protein n=1 Tax=Arachis hypogaea TaxID=3818 RepID=A0A444Y2U3_ARAHY|nr:hypothetical protein Ahy_B08g091967 [Arachis hypogaea]
MDQMWKNSKVYKTRTAIRPFLPELEVRHNENPGGGVEVYQNYSLKMATVSKDLRNNHVSVRVHEKFTQFQVNQFHMGTRKSSKDDKKILVGKYPNSEHKYKDKLSGSNDYHTDKMVWAFLTPVLVHSRH